MKMIKKIFKIITAIILIPTVALVAFILIADASDMEFKTKSEEAPVVQRSITVPGIAGFDFQDDGMEEVEETAASVSEEN